MTFAAPASQAHQHRQPQRARQREPRSKDIAARSVNGSRRPAEPPAVVTVTVAAVADPLSVTELGDIEQVEWVRAPLQLSFTV